MMTCSGSCFGLLNECYIIMGVSGGHLYCNVVGTCGGRPLCIIIGTHSNRSYYIIIGVRGGRPCCIRNGKCITIRVGCIKFVLS